MSILEMADPDSAIPETGKILPADVGGPVGASAIGPIGAVERVTGISIGAAHIRPTFHVPVMASRANALRSYPQVSRVHRRAWGRHQKKAGDQQKGKSLHDGPCAPLPVLPVTRKAAFSHHRQAATYPSNRK
jgi:hypothetical protein